MLRPKVIPIERLMYNSRGWRLCGKGKKEESLSLAVLTAWQATKPRRMACRYRQLPSYWNVQTVTSTNIEMRKFIDEPFLTPQGPLK